MLEKELKLVAVITGVVDNIGAAINGGETKLEEAMKKLKGVMKKLEEATKKLEEAMKNTLNTVVGKRIWISSNQ